MCFYLNEHMFSAPKLVTPHHIYCICLFVLEVAHCHIMWLLVGIKAKVSNNPFIKCATEFPLILWHPYARHHYFCVMTEKEQKKWHAVLQDCARHSNNGNDSTSLASKPTSFRKVFCKLIVYATCFVLHPGWVHVSAIVGTLDQGVCVCVTLWGFTCHVGELVALRMRDVAGMLHICFFVVFFFLRVALGYSWHAFVIGSGPQWFTSFRVKTDNVRHSNSGRGLS